MRNFLSEPGAIVLEGHEGTVQRAYRCPAGRMTIGTGYTEGSQIFSAYWRKKTGSSKIKRGQTITRAESLRLLPKIVDEEYGAAVSRRFGLLKQHQYDASSSVCFNCGPGSLKWKWAVALANGNIAESAARLRVTAVTGGGKRHVGLVKRRKSEASLLETGNYGRHLKKNPPLSERPSISVDRDAVREYQGWLKELGYYTGKLDGISGTKTDTAVRSFQLKHPHLTNDGIVGPATRASLLRAMNARKAPAKTAGGAAGGAAAGSGSAATVPDADLPILEIGAWGGVVAGVAFAAFFTWRYRDEIRHVLGNRKIIAGD